jgi:hypothetical protein
MEKYIPCSPWSKYYQGSENPPHGDKGVSPRREKSADPVKSADHIKQKLIELKEN